MRARALCWRDWAPVALVYHVDPAGSPGASVLLVVGSAAAWLFLLARPLMAVRRKALLFVAFAMALGPGAPRQHDAEGPLGPGAARRRSTAFGGVPPVHPGAVAGGRMPAQLLVCLGPCRTRLFAGRLRLFVAGRAGAAPGRSARHSGLAALVGLVRIAQGGHFLSDVVYAGLLVFGTTALLHWWIVERDALAAPLAVSLSPVGCGRYGAASAVVASAGSAAAIRRRRRC